MAAEPPIASHFIIVISVEARVFTGCKTMHSVNIKLQATASYRENDHKYLSLKTAMALRNT